MTVKHVFHLVLLCSAISPLLRCEKTGGVDLVIHNGTIYTMDETSPTVEAVAVTGGVITRAGAYHDIRKLTGTRTRVLDLRGRTMTPGFIESHGHFLSLGKAKMRLDLNNVASYDELVALVAEAV